MTDDIFAPYTVDQSSFAYRDMIGQDRWQATDETVVPFTYRFSVTLIVGTPTYKIRWNVRGRLCVFAATFSATTSITTTAGVSFMDLPIARRNVAGAIVPIGLAGNVSMMDQTGLLWIGGCVIDPGSGRLYLPAQAATGNLLSVAGSYEV